MPVRVGTADLFAAIDSGSSGLRVVAPALRASDYQAIAVTKRDSVVTGDRLPRPAPGSNQPSTYGYESGTVLHGIRAQANVSFGSVHGPVTIQVIQSLSCSPDRPNCAEGRLPIQHMGLMGGGKPDQGAPAIIGIHSSDIPVIVPFPALGVKRWIVDIPNDLGGGQLVLNPPEESLAGFVRFPLPAGSGAEPSDAIRGCLQNDKTNQRICGFIEFDTGAPGLSVASPDPLPKSWPPHTPASLSYQDEHGTTRLVQSFRTGDPAHSSRLRFDPAPKQRFTVIHANASPYFCFDVLYQADHQASMVTA